MATYSFMVHLTVVDADDRDQALDWIVNVMTDDKDLKIDSIFDTDASENVTREYRKKYEVEE